MKNPKETAGKVTATGEMEICHGSVCVGDKTPKNCICPTTKK
jgi:hypothetical protein